MSIIPYIPIIIDKLFSHPILILTAPPGSGKTLFVPPNLAKLGYRVFVSVPTRLSATMAFNNAKNIFPDMDFGVAAEGEHNYNDRTQCVFATFGAIKRKLMKCIDENGKPKDITFCDILIHDEIHNPGLDNTMNMMLSIYIKKAGLLFPRMILTTATIKPQYKVMFPDADIYEIEGRNYPIQIIYSDRDYIRYDFKEDSNFFKDLVKYIMITVTTVSNNILVFFPGKQEISETRKYLEANYSDKLRNIKILEIYSGADPADQKIVENKDYQGRLLILASNVAETSVSISRLDAVVDTMLEKILVTTETGSTKLETALISKASATQRAGRSGRFYAGRCTRLITERRFQTLADSLDDEILRLPIEKPILEVISLRIDVYEFFINVPRTRITDTLNNLIRFNCISRNEDGSLVMLDKGVFISDLQAGLRISSCLFEWYNRGYNMAEGVITFCLIDSASPTYFFFPKPKRDESLDSYNKRFQEHLAKFFEKYQAHSDVETYLKLWNDYMLNIRGDYTLKDGIMRFASKNSINAQKFKECIQNIKNTATSLSKKLRESISIEEIDIDRTILRALPILAENFSDRVMISRQGKYVDFKGVTYRLDKSGISRINVKRDTYVLPIVYLETEEAVRVGVAIPYNLSKLYNI